MAEETLRRVARLLGLADTAIYSERTRLRQDDLLIRSRASQALARAATALRDLASRYAAERIPAASRENPFPPKAQLAALRGLEKHLRAVQALEAEVRSAPFPTEAEVWERPRSASLQIDALLLLDAALIERDAAVETLGTATGQDDVEAGAAPSLDSALADLHTTLRERSELLAAPV